jgi:anthranilate synthase component 2
MYLLIDNYDSFTYNLVQVLQGLDIFPRVLRHDHPDLLGLAAASCLQAVIISPGPGGPDNAGQCLEFLRALPSRIPVLGVCLGHQILASHAGYPVIRSGRIMHGKTSAVSHRGSGLFSGLPQPFTATRYHSLIMDCSPQSTALEVEVTAWSEHGEPMALAYVDRPWMGIQFHPESILTPDGPALIRNFVRQVGTIPDPELEPDADRFASSMPSAAQQPAEHRNQNHIFAT